MYGSQWRNIVVRDIHGRQLQLEDTLKYWKCEGVRGSSESLDEEEWGKIRQKQLHFAALIHAHFCVKKPNKGSDCELPHCSTMKNILYHHTHCAKMEECSEPLCYSSRLMTLHCRKNCGAEECSVCGHTRNMREVAILEQQVVIGRAREKKMIEQAEIERLQRELFA